MAPISGNAPCVDEIIPLTVAGVDALVRDMARIDPWARLGITADTLRAGLTAHRVDRSHFEARIDDRAIGLLSVQQGWLFGPYIRLLAVLPAAQGRGVGGALLQHADRLARDNGSANVWVCASAFNLNALQFYERHGFQRIGQIDDLVADGEAEVLLRRRLTA